jgi:hypothetical protein
MRTVRMRRSPFEVSAVAVRLAGSNEKEKNKKKGDEKARELESVSKEEPRDCRSGDTCEVREEADVLG